MARKRHKKRTAAAAAVAPYRQPAVRETGDDWYSTTSGIGGVRDKHRGITYAGKHRMRRTTLDALYTYEPLIAREIDLPADDAMRAGWEIKNIKTKQGTAAITPEQVKKWCDEIKCDASIVQAQKWKSLYGGSLIVLPIDDGEDPREALAIGPSAGPKAMYPLRVLMADHAQPGESDGDFSSPTYLETLFYEIQGLATDTEQIHRTRVIPFEAIKLSPETLTETSALGWGPSVIERMFAALSADGAAGSHAIAMMYISSVMHIGIKGFREEFGKRGGPERLQKWLAGVQRKMESLGIVALDAEDTIGNMSLQVSGMDALLNSMRDRLASSSSQPREIFLNESPTGLRGGELSGPQEIWNKKVEALQTGESEPALRRILDVLFLSKALSVISYEIEWNPLWVRSEESAATLMDSISKSDSLAIMSGQVTADEVRKFRNVDGNTGILRVPPAPAGSPMDLSAAASPDDVAAAEAAAAEEGAPPASVGDPAAAAGMMAIVEKVMAGTIPHASGVAILQATFPTFAAMAPQIMGPPPAAPTVDAGAIARPEPTPPPDDLVSVREAGAMIGVSTNQINMAITKGTLPYWGIGTKKNVSKSDLGKMMKAHEAPAAAEPVAAPVAPGPGQFA